jgi:hypothetical protein
MAPPIENWTADQLEDRAQVTTQGRRRKGFDGNLKACELLELLQYECRVEGRVTKESLIRCWPVERLFRR